MRVPEGRLHQLTSPPPTPTKCDSRRRILIRAADYGNAQNGRHSSARMARGLNQAEHCRA
jgi:hypothetical protein